MKKLTLIVISLFLWAYFILSSILLTPIGLIIYLFSLLFDRKLRFLHLFSCFWGAQYIWVVPLWSLQIYDRDKFKKGRNYIVISNHQSLADIIVIYSLFKIFRWTSKVENFSLPFVGWVLSLNHSIRIYRGASDAYRLFEEQAVKSLKDGMPVMIFPEGTRSKDGTLGKFKDGAFRLAHDTGTDILPMVLDGTSKAIPKSGWILTGKEKMVLKVLDPVPFDEFKDLSIAETSQLLRERIDKGLNEIRSIIR